MKEKRYYHLAFHYYYWNISEGDVRLVEGSNAYEGRVEVFSGGRWGTVCGRLFDEAEGRVVCHQLGLGSVALSWKPVSVMYDAYFGGNANLPINLEDARCVGVEDRLTVCDGTWGDDVVECDHSQDVGIICSYGNETEGDIRLVGAGVGIESEGRVQILRHNEWGTICHYSWDLKDADVACRQLGFEMAILATRNSMYGGGNLGQTVMLSNVRCNGTEEHLLDCENDGWGVADCELHQEDAGIVCENEVFEGTMRLTGEIITQEGYHEGLLEIYDGGSWGTVCMDESFLNTEAVVACRHLGFNRVARFGTTTTPGSGVIKLDQVSCYGYELTLGNCRHGVWGNPSPSCTYDTNVPTNVRLTCFNEPATHGEVRLVNGFTFSHGRVEYYDEYEEHWSTICSSTSMKSDMEIANVVCRQLGYLAASDSFGRSYFGPGSTDQSIDIVRCNGFEAAFEDCEHDLYSGDCEEHGNDIGVVCTDQVYEGIVRLVDGSDYTKGRLEIYHGDRWGTICNSSWTGDDASVACRELGLGNVKYAYENYGPGNGPVHLDDVGCRGTEVNLTNCQKSDWGVSECGHDHDVGLSCFLFKEPETAEVRLTGGSSFKEGRLEFYSREDTWYSVCKDESWGQAEAQVVCNVLELEVESGDVDFGPALYPGMISNVDCIGTESDFDFCYYYIENNDCGAENTVGIVCKDVPVPPSEGNVRLRDGETFDEGRLEIYHNGVWGYICRTNWKKSEAKVACRQLGYDHVSKVNIYTNYISRPVHLDHVQCVGDEERLTDCYYRPWGDVSCSPSYGVGIACSEDPEQDPIEGWAIALIVIFSFLVFGFGASSIGYILYKKRASTVNSVSQS
nr:deleted in malignant brain tumors 1 protein-like [Lytechinus pictus]